MHRPRHRPRSSARLSFSLLSVLALLAFAALPALAQAEDSSGVQYDTEHYESGAKPQPNEPKAGSQKEPGAEASRTPSGGQHEGAQAPEGNSAETKEGKGAPAGGGNNGGGSNGGNANKASSSGGNQGSEDLSGEKELGGTTQAKPVSSSGGSSPLVPILIAIAVLAAISIGAVIYRQRRQGSGGSGSPVSPKAG